MDRDLDLAYRYPFSESAKRIVASQPNTISQKYLDMAKSHIEAAINEGLGYRETKLQYLKLDYLMSYLYARMILSAIVERYLAKRYAIAEAQRAVEAAYTTGKEEVIALANELGLEISARFDPAAAFTYNEFAIRFDQYLRIAPAQKGYELVNQRLSTGTVIMDRDKLRGLLANAVMKEILKGLPIRSSELPKDVVEFARANRLAIKIAEPEAKKRTGLEGWIEKLLKTPIPDVRHRTVNLILAPYLVNVRGLSVEEATRIITEYIERCKEIDPATKITGRYIQYQCDYAKKRELRPLSFERAKELLHGALDIEGMK